MALIAFELIGCEEDAAETLASARRRAEKPPIPLSVAFLDRATTALSDRLTDDSRILEIRASGRLFSVQLAEDSEEESGLKVVQIDYAETPGPEGRPPVGRIHGPSPIELKGQGKVEENLFPFTGVSLTKVARSFSVAQLAVDPDDGKVEKLVVRRFLPFSSRVRARIFVHSPRMSGSIDTTHLGVPLKR